MINSVEESIQKKSRKNIKDISQGEKTELCDSIIDRDFEIDKESQRLLIYLSKELNLEMKLALKHALIIASYIHDLTVNQKAKMLIKVGDNPPKDIKLL